MRLSGLFSVSTGATFEFGRKLGQHGKKKRRGQKKEEDEIDGWEGGRVAINSLPFIT